MSDERRLTCHVLDVTRGAPGSGVGVTLSRLDAATREVLVTASTNADGRTDAPLLAGDDLVPGHYELAFAVGDYFAGTAGVGAVPFLDVVPIHFGVAPDVGHLHVALLVTPWSYTTYRGS
jgi:5-hydroxyisourate hydrolase